MFKFVSFLETMDKASLVAHVFSSSKLNTVFLGYIKKVIFIS
jgi:hypothetical protein